MLALCDTSDASLFYQFQAFSLAAGCQLHLPLTISSGLHITFAANTFFFLGWTLINLLRQKFLGSIFQERFLLKIPRTTLSVYFHKLQTLLFSHFIDFHFILQCAVGEALILEIFWNHFETNWRRCFNASVKFSSIWKNHHHKCRAIMGKTYSLKRDLNEQFLLCFSFYQSRIRPQAF